VYRWSRYGVGITDAGFAPRPVTQVQFGLRRPRHAIDVSSRARLQAKNTKVLSFWIGPPETAPVLLAADGRGRLDLDSFEK